METRGTWCSYQERRLLRRASNKGMEITNLWLSPLMARLATHPRARICPLKLARAKGLWVPLILLMSAISSAQSIRITEYAMPTGNAPWGITTGSDGALWFTEYYDNKIGRISTVGAITEYAIPTPNNQPNSITSGPDGALWFTEFFGNKIGRITTGGAITEYPVPTPGSNPTEIGMGPDGALWFTEQNGNKIGRITPGGAMTEIGRA